VKRIIVLVSNDLSYDQRVAKTCTWWHNQGYSVTLIGFSKRQSSPVSFDFASIRFLNPFQQGVLFYAWIQFRLFFYLLFQRTTFVWCNDLDTLWPAVALKRLKKWEIVYDAHECFTESVGLMNHRFKRNLWLRLEQFCIPRADHCYTVSKGIQKFYQAHYSHPFEVIRNLPDLSVEPKSIEKPKVWEGRQILIYHGVFNPHRGLEELIQAMPTLSDAILILIGYGEQEGVLKDKVSSLNLSERVFFTGPMEYPKILGLLKHADLGIALEKPVSISFTNALPNKIFDYARVGLPFVTLGNPEVKSILEKYPIGQIVHSLDTDKLADGITRCIRQKQAQEAMYAAARESFFQDNNAELEWSVLKAILK
jgi:glycosyltransferase involved in cell wall biosynthesis